MLESWSGLSKQKKVSDASNITHCLTLWSSKKMQTTKHLTKISCLLLFLTIPHIFWHLFFFLAVFAAHRCLKSALSKNPSLLLAPSPPPARRQFRGLRSFHGGAARTAQTPSRGLRSIQRTAEGCGKNHEETQSLLLLPQKELCKVMKLFISTLLDFLGVDLRGKKLQEAPLHRSKSKPNHGHKKAVAKNMQQKSLKLEIWQTPQLPGLFLIANGYCRGLQDEWRESWAGLELHQGDLVVVSYTQEASKDRLWVK